MKNKIIISLRNLDVKHSVEVVRSIKGNWSQENRDFPVSKVESRDILKGTLEDLLAGKCFSIFILHPNVVLLLCNYLCSCLVNKQTP